MSLRKHVSTETHPPQAAALESRSSGLKGALARPKGRRAKKAAPSPTAGPDPIFAAIAAAREAERYADDTPGGYEEDGTPESDAHDEELTRRTDLSDEAHRAVFRIAPTTSAGLLALVDFAIEQKDVLVRWESSPDVLGAIRAGVAAQMESGGSPGPIPSAAPHGLAASIMDHWKAWRVAWEIPEDDPQADAAQDRASIRRDELLDAAEALPATPDNLLVKALALAWTEAGVGIHPSIPREGRGFQDKLQFDINAIILDRLATPSSPSMSDTAPAGSDATAQGFRAPSTTLIADAIDFRGLSLDLLLSLHDTADMVGGVAYATAWQSRSASRELEGSHNVSGELMQWLGDALTSVETAAGEEARRRTPVNHSERETRLALLSQFVIPNGDPDETAAFARELADHASTMEA